MALQLSWTSFHCENPDFTVRSIPDDVSFEVNRTAMQTSEVFSTRSLQDVGPIIRLTV